MTIEILESVQELVVISCGVCGTPFAIHAVLHSRFHSTGKSFYCPNGHCISYSDSENERLKKALRDEQTNNRWWKNKANIRATELKKTKNQLRGTKAAYTRMKNRIAGGVCPYCNRQFENISRHMKTEHTEILNKENKHDHA